MDIFTIALWLGTFIFLVISLVKNKDKTMRALKMALGMGRGMVGSIISIIFGIGLILTILPPNEIAYYVSKQSTLLSTIVAASFGTITLIPAFIAYPLVGTLISAGISVIPAVAFLTTLTMVGVVTFPLEKKEFGFKFTAIRNSLSFVFAILVALIMGVMM